MSIVERGGFFDYYVASELVPNSYVSLLISQSLEKARSGKEGIGMISEFRFGSIADGEMENPCLLPR
jgi:hypothetical protein